MTAKAPSNGALARARRPRSANTWRQHPTAVVEAGKELILRSMAPTRPGQGRGIEFNALAGKDLRRLLSRRALLGERQAGDRHKPAFPDLHTKKARRNARRPRIVAFHRGLQRPNHASVAGATDFFNSLLSQADSGVRQALAGFSMKCQDTMAQTSVPTNAIRAS